MTAEEFNKTAIRTEDTTGIHFDVRPFGNREAEAIDWYLHEVGMQVNYRAFSTSKPIFVRYSKGLEILATTRTWLQNLLALGVPMNLKEEESKGEG